MADYQRMYYILCAAASRALDMLPDTIINSEGRKILQDALIKAENLYLQEADSIKEAVSDDFVKSF